MNLKTLLSRFSLGMVLLLFFTSAMAQNKTITGTVTDSKDRQPLIGVSVAVKGTAIGASTGADGTFRLSVPESATTLVFSYLGYVSQDVNITGRATVNVSLEPSSTSLSEVVVVGYGTQRAKDVTGSVSSIGNKEFNKGVINSPEQLLQGKVSGVQVTPASGEPGAGINIRIRGTTSVRSGNNPLFVVDGVPLDGSNISEGAADYGTGSASARNPLNFLNPADIENITVLKDASSAAIYGSRGANGVVLITTKKGKAGQDNLNFTTSFSSASALKTYDVMDASQFLSQAANTGADPVALNKGANTDWQDVILRTGLTQNYSLGFGGGTERTLYRLSVSHAAQTGIMENSGLDKTTARLNASHELLNNRVKIDMQLTASRLDDEYTSNGDNAGFLGNLLGAALAANPTVPINDPNNPSGFTQSADFRNPAAVLALIKEGSITNKVLGNIGLNWDIVSGLKYKFNGGFDNSNSTRKIGISRLLDFDGIKDRGRAINSNRELGSYLLEHTLNYNTAIGDIHTFDALAGFSYQKFSNKGFFLDARNFLTDEIPYSDNIDGVNNDGNNKAFFAGSDRTGSELQSYFGRVNYSLMSKYLLTATLRADGSSKFGANNKYGYFPSLAAAWRISEESFLPENLFSELKLRAGWGITGNQEFPGGITRAAFQVNSSGSITQRNNPNPDITWEETEQISVGVDFGILNGKLSGSVDYFDKTTEDLLTQVSYAQPAAVEFKWINLPGQVKNKGFEFSLNYNAIKSDNFSWDVNANASFLKNKVTNFGNTIIPTGNINGQGLSGAYAQRIADGLPLGAFYLPVFEGYDADGLAIYPNDAAFQYVGSALPKNTYGLNNSFAYKNLSLSFFLNAVTGFYVYNNTANALFTKGSLKNGRNVTVDAATSPEGALNAPEVSTRFLEKGDFLRLSNATLSYRFPMVNNKYVKGMSMNLTGQNLFLITNYSGVDPEVNTDKNRNGVPSLGIDYTSYPSARIFTFGASFDF